MAKHPSILTYIESKRADLYDLIDSLGMQGMFSPRKGSAGLTFLMPSKEKVASMAKRARGNDAEEVTDELSALLVHAYLPTVADWKAQMSDLPTAVGKHLVVEEAKGTTVKLPGGTLKPDPGYVPFERVGKQKRGTTSVWLLEGEVDYKSAPDNKSPFRPKIHEDAKRGGADVVGGLCCRLIIKLEERYVDYIKRLGTAFECIDPFEECLASFIAFFYVYDKKNTGMKVLDRLRVVMSRCPMSTLYCLLEPYRMTNPIITDEELLAWCGPCCNYIPIDNPGKVIKWFIDSVSNLQLYSNIEEERKTIINNTSVNKVGLPRKFAEYARNFAEGHIGRVPLPYPKEVVSMIYGSNPCRKCFHDELHFLLTSFVLHVDQLRNIKNEGYLKLERDTRVSEAKSIFASLMVALSSKNDYAKLTKCVDPDYWKGSCAASTLELYSQPGKLLRSSFFLHVLMPSEIASQRGTQALGRPDERDKIFNYDAHLDIYLDRAPSSVDDIHSRMAQITEFKDEIRL